MAVPPVFLETTGFLQLSAGAKVAEGLNLFRCDKSHEHSLRFVLRETQHYPDVLCRRVLESLG